MNSDYQNRYAKVIADFGHHIRQNYGVVLTKDQFANGTVSFFAHQITQLQDRIKELEDKLNERNQNRTA